MLDPNLDIANVQTYPLDGTTVELTKRVPRNSTEIIDSPTARK